MTAICFALKCLHGSTRKTASKFLHRARDVPQIPLLSCTSAVLCCIYFGAQLRLRRRTLMNSPLSKPNGSRALPIRVPRVCVAILGSDPAEMIEKAENLVRENSFFEFRLDYLKDPAAGAAKIRQFMHMHPEVISIATCRRAQNGGHFKGSVASQIAVLTKAASLGFQFVDVEIESAEAMK